MDPTTTRGAQLPSSSSPSSSTPASPPKRSLEDLLLTMTLQEENDIRPNNRLQVAGAVCGSVIAATVALTAPFVISKSILPYMATPGPKVYAALTHLMKQHQGRQRRPRTRIVQPPIGSQNNITAMKHQANERSGGVFVDLGSGDGEAVYQAVRRGYHARAIGIELNFTLWLLSSIRRRFFWSYSERQRSQFIWSNFYDYSLKDANTVMIFGVAPLMESLSNKIANECRPGTHILSYRFGLPLAPQEQQIEEQRQEEELEDPLDRRRRLRLLKAKIVYDAQEMRVYECG